MTTRHVRRTIRRSTGGIDVAADINAVIATGEGNATTATSSQHTVVTQTTPRRGAPAKDQTRGET